MDSRKADADKIIEDSLMSTRSMVKMCQETENVKDKTLRMLEGQGEQLDCIGKGIDRINSDMKEAEKHLNGMEKWFGIIPLPKKRDSNIKEARKAAEQVKKCTRPKTKKNYPDKKNTHPKCSQHDKTDSNHSKYSCSFVQPINGDPREDEMEENLQLVASMINNIKKGAIEMGETLEDQNDQLDSIVNKSEETTMRTESANKRSKNLLSHEL